MRHGIDFAAYLKMTKQIEEAEPPSVDELSRPETHRAEIFGLFESGYRRGISTGWRCFDELFTVRHGELTVITGIPGHGKSSWLDNLMVHLSQNSGWHWAVFSAENYPIARHVSGLMEIYSGKPFSRGPSDRMTPTEVELSLKWVDSYFQFIQPREDSYSLNRIVQLAAQVPNLDALVIDPWNELDHSRPKDMREDEHISVSLSKLRWLARTANIHVFVVAHPAKYIRQKGEAKPVITLNEVKGASEWYAKADNGISVWRDEGQRDSPSEIHIQKIRFREVGRVGMATLYYDRTTGRFIDPNQRPTIEDYVSRMEREPGCDDQ